MWPLEVLIQMPLDKALDEVAQVLDGIRKPAKQAGVDETAEALWAFFVDRCVHVLVFVCVLCRARLERKK